MKTLLPFLLLVMSGLPSMGAMKFKRERIPVTVAPDAKEVMVEFPFTVDGDGAKVLSYDAPCTCLSARIEPLNPDRSARLLWKPGESGKVVGKFELGNFRGTVEKAIVLKLENQKAVQLVVEVTIPELIKISPVTQRWEQGSAGEEKSFKIEIHKDHPITIKNVRGTNPNFPYELIEHEAGRSYEIRCKALDTKTPGFGMIRIETDSLYTRFKRLQIFQVVQKKKP